MERKAYWGRGNCLSASALPNLTPKSLLLLMLAVFFLALPGRSQTTPLPAPVICPPSDQAIGIGQDLNIAAETTPWLQTDGTFFNCLTNPTYRLGNTGIGTYLEPKRKLHIGAIYPGEDTRFLDCDRPGIRLSTYFGDWENSCDNMVAAGFSTGDALRSWDIVADKYDLATALPSNLSDYGLFFSLVRGSTTAQVTAMSMFQDRIGAFTLEPGSTFSVNGSSSIGSGFSTMAAPNDGLLVEGLTRIGNDLSSSFANTQRLLVGAGSNLVNNNIGQIQNGTFGGASAGDQWSTLGGPGGLTAFNRFYGLRLNSGLQSVNLYLERASSTLTDPAESILQWSDNSATATTRSTAQPFRISSRVGTAAGTDVQTIATFKADGNVGIGVTNPGVRLDVRNDRSAISTVDFEPGSRFVFIGNPNNGPIGGQGFCAASVEAEVPTSITPNSSTVVSGLISTAKGGAAVNIGIQGTSKSTVSNQQNFGVVGVISDAGAEVNVGVKGEAVPVGGTGTQNFTCGVLGSTTPNLSGTSTLSDGNVWGVFSSGDIGLIGQEYITSDIRLKTNVSRFEASDVIEKIGTYTFKYKSDGIAMRIGLESNRTHFGVMAQELKEILPQLVQESVIPIKENNLSLRTEKVMMVNYQELIPILIQGLKETNQKVGELEKKLLNSSYKEQLTSTSRQLNPGITLGDAVPNPTSSYARITYSIPNKNAVAILTMLNLNGVIVREIPLNAEDTAIEIDVTQLPAGMYIYNLTATGYKSLTKTLIVR